MKDVTKTIKKIGEEALLMQPEQEAKTHQIIGQTEKTKVDWFYDTLMAIYGAGKWQQTFPDGLALSKSKNVYAGEICALTRDQVIRGLSELKRKKQQLDKAYMWPDVDVAIGCCKSDGDDWGHKTKAYRIWKPERRLANGTEEDRQKAGEEGLKNLRKLIKMG